MFTPGSYALALPGLPLQARSGYAPEVLLLLFIAASSWLQKVNAASKQAGLLGDSAAELAGLCEAAEAAGRPQTLSVIRSENERIQATLGRLESRVAALESHTAESP